MPRVGSARTPPGRSRLSRQHARLKACYPIPLAIGFEGPASPGALLGTGHLGLVTMRERVEQLGGHLAVNTAPGQGTEICVCLTSRSHTPEHDVARLLTGA